MATQPALVNLPIETSDAGFYSGFSKDVTISAKILVSALIIWVVVFPENASNVLSTLNLFLLSNFASWYIFVVAFYVMVCLLFALVPSSGKLLLSRPGETSEFSNFSFFRCFLALGSVSECSPLQPPSQFITLVIILTSFADFPQDMRPIMYAPLIAGHSCIGASLLGPAMRWSA